MIINSERINNIHKKNLRDSVDWKLIKAMLQDISIGENAELIFANSNLTSMSLSTLLYQLNLIELMPPGESNYETYEKNKIACSLLRVFIENFLLNEIKHLQQPKIPFPLNLRDKNSLYEFLMMYIQSSLDDSYVNWFEQSATLNDAKSFVREYGADQVYFTQYLSQLSIIAPEKAAIEIYTNLFDETGLDIFNREERNFSLFHPEIFRRLHNYFSLNPVNRFHCKEIFNPETYYCICMMLLSIRLGYLQGAGALFLLENSIPQQLSKISKGFKRLKVPKEKRLFFDMHCDLDEAHALNWWNYAIKDYIMTPQDFSNLILGINIAISARNKLWLGLQHARRT
ncbi:MAG: iron-containing redox enzyme family protein [Alphaproteobacteria bacterium]|nr:iron-containing redox enzyme family protein [Alphaproteobacteria bacterium]